MNASMAQGGGTPSSHAAVRVILLCVAVLALVALYLASPAEQALLPKCPFKLLTGLNCPGCGFQRAMHALLHGHVREAIGYNLFLPFALPYLLALLTERTLLKGNLQRKWQAALESKPMVGFYVAAYAAWFIVRNLLHL